MAAVTLTVPCGCCSSSSSSSSSIPSSSSSYPSSASSASPSSPPSSGSSSPSSPSSPPSDSSSSISTGPCCCCTLPFGSTLCPLGCVGCLSPADCASLGGICDLPSGHFCTGGHFCRAFAPPLDCPPEPPP